MPSKVKKEFPGSTINRKTGESFRIWKKSHSLRPYAIVLQNSAGVGTQVGNGYRRLKNACQCIRKLTLSSPDYDIIYFDAKSDIPRF